MLMLVTKADPTIRRHAHPALGRLVTPRHYSSIEATAHAGIPWAADNDAFSGFEPGAFMAMLDRLAGLPGCLFVTCPDVVADAAATARRFARWAGAIRRTGLPVALAAQDGLDRLAVPWEEIDALFVGGSTTWKLSDHAARLVAEANARGIWTHMGRVNSARRLEWAKAIGCRSVDGTSYARFTDTHLPAARPRRRPPPARARRAGVTAAALQLPGLEQPACWQIRHRSDPAALRLADRHYSRKTPGAPWLGPPGRALVLVTGDETALWVTHWPAADKALDGLDAWRCSIFRNEGPSLSSVLIGFAMDATLRWWAEARAGSTWFTQAPADGWVTWIDRRRVRSSNPGYCFLRAGWERDRTWSSPYNRYLIRLRAKIPAVPA
jgi:hypothetical protein